MSIENKICGISLLFSEVLLFLSENTLKTNHKTHQSFISAYHRGSARLNSGDFIVVENDINEQPVAEYKVSSEQQSAAACEDVRSQNGIPRKHNARDKDIHHHYEQLREET